MTVPYPMTVAGKAQEHRVKTAIEELRLREMRLFDEGSFYLRSYPDGRRTFRRWPQGLSWYLLGLVPSLEIIGSNEAPDLVEAFQRAAA